MLMTVLRCDLAINESRALVRTFKKMKDYILSNKGLIDQREVMQLSMQTADNSIGIHKLRMDLGSVEKQMSDEWNNRLLSVRQEKISADNVYQLLLAFDKLYNTFTEVEQRDFMRAFIERIDIYPEKPDNGCWIRNIVFNFPMPVQGKEIKRLPLESKSTVET